MTSNDLDLKTQFVTISGNNGVVFVTPAGPTIGERESNIIRDDVSHALEPLTGAISHLVLDMSMIDFMSSVGIGMCVDLRNLAASRGADAIVTGANRAMQELFKLVQLDRKFKVAADDSAVQKILANAKPKAA